MFELEHVTVIVVVKYHELSICYMITLNNIIVSYINRRFYILVSPKHITMLAGCDDSDVKPTIFKYDELHTATRGFHIDMKLGEGGFGDVYKVSFLKSIIF